MSGAASPTVGQAVSLTATVTPARLRPAQVTFYDGACVLDSAALTGDKAVFTTTTLAGPSHVSGSVRRHAGAAPGVLSSPVSHTVGAVPARWFLTSVDVNPGFPALRAGVADVDRNGKVDLLAADYWWDDKWLLPGRGDGTLSCGHRPPNREHDSPSRAGS